MGGGEAYIYLHISTTQIALPAMKLEKNLIFFKLFDMCWPDDVDLLLSYWKQSGNWA